MRTSAEQYLNSSGLIDKKIGHLYELLETVKNNLSTYKHISYYMENLFDIHNNLTDLVKLSTQDNALNFTNDNITDLTTYFSNLNTLITNRDSLDALANEIEENSNLAQKWANEAEDTEVETGLFSALHYAAKASSILLEIQTIKNETNQIKTDTETLKNAVDLAKTSVETKALTVDTKAQEAADSAQIAITKATEAANLVLAAGSGQSLGINVKTLGAIGDGVADDTAAIQAAIDAVGQQGGGVLDFPAGTYLIHHTVTETLATRTLRSCLQIEYDNVHINLHKNAILKIADAQDNNDRITAIRIGRSSGDVGSNTSITGLGEIDGNYQNQLATPSAVSDILHRAAIFVFGEIENLLIKDITIRNSQGDALYVTGTNDFLKAKDVVVFNVKMLDCAEGFVWTRCDDVKILFGRARTFIQDAYEPTFQCNGVLIYGVTVEEIGPGNSSIDLFGGNFVKVINCNLKGKVNIASGVTNPSASMKDVLIQGNTITDGYIEIGQSPFEIRDVRIMDNRISGSTDLGDPGIRVLSGTGAIHPGDIKIFGNHISDVGGIGIDVAQNCFDVEIKNNTIIDAGSDDLTGADFCIRASGSSQTIIGNKLIERRAVKTQQRAMVFFGAIGDLIVRDNEIKGLTDTTIDFQAMGALIYFDEGNNRGHISKRVFEITIPNGQSSASLPHGLSTVIPAVSSSNISFRVTALDAAAGQRIALLSIQGANLFIFTNSTVTADSTYQVEIERFQI